MSTRLKQVLIITVAAAIALGMVFLGLWQMQVFVDEGARSVEQRAAQPAEVLDDHLASDDELGELYGKQVVVEGTYLPDHQILVPTDGAYRVLGAIEIADGRTLPIVRGLTADPEAIAAPPTGVRSETGIFLPGEGNVLNDQGVHVDVPAGQLPSVRMPALAQEWPEQLVPGFVTLGEADAAAHGLDAASVALPTGEGSAQNSGYALQWWVFAVFGMGMAIKLAHGLGVRDRKAKEAALLENHRKDVTA